MCEHLGELAYHSHRMKMYDANTDSLNVCEHLGELAYHGHRMKMYDANTDSLNVCEHLGELAYHGHRVKMYDANTDSLNSAYERIEEDKHHLQHDGLLPQLNFIVCILLFCPSKLTALGFCLGKL